jgi:hypothetical protein
MLIGTLAIFAIILGFSAMLYYAHYVPKSKIVDEYEISLTKGEFPVVRLLFKLDNNQKLGPFEFAPAFAHALSDELCAASARASKKDVMGLKNPVN